MNKKFFNKSYKVAAVVIMLLSVPAVVGAADIEIECVTSGGGVSCEAMPTGVPLFDEENLAPGDTVIRELKVTNSHGEVCAFELNTKSEEAEELDLADRLFTVLRDSSDKYGVSDGSAAANNKTMSDLFVGGPILLGTLAANSTTNYEWAVTFDAAAGNDWQHKETVFDFDMVFTCEEAKESGGGDEEDCCPGPDPSPVGGAVLGTTTGIPPGKIAGALLSRFPVAGDISSALWLEKNEADWSRVMSGILSVVLSIYLILRNRREKMAKSR